ncbi:MAG: hypothetical protein IK093_07235 [Ruminiclostridium sp.]|nr:hypothetical protein [Ruminiclostridium sp.]
MNEVTINEEITLKYRDGFDLMDDEELKKHFGVSGNNWGIYDRGQHTIISFAWNKVNGFMAWLADPNSVANGIEKRMRDNLGGFERTSDVCINICGKKAEGFTFEYYVEDGNIKMVGKILSFRIGKCFYVIQFVTRAEREQEANADFDAVIASVALKGN